MPLPNETIKELLLKSKTLNEEEFNAVERESQRTGVPVIRLLIANGRLTQGYLNELISGFLNIPIFDFKASQLKPETIEALPESIARRRQIIVFGKNQEKNSFKVAMADATDIENINFLKEYLKGEIEPYIASLSDLKMGFRLYKKKSSKEFETMISERVREVGASLKQGGGANILESVPLVQLFDTIIDYAAILDASDIYFQPEEDVLKIRFRVDGLLKDIISIDKSINDGVVARAKTLSGLRIDEHLKPQDGRFRFRSSDIDLDIRTAIMPTFFGEKISLRILGANQSFISFEELGMNQNIIENLIKAVKRPYGMVLSSGPTGSGKTTTIYGILNVLNKPEVHITTIEDPVEYIVQNVSQTQVNQQAGIDFASGLRALLRHSPDIIFIGEIRDTDTAGISVNAALTGHLLISTIHTNDAPGAVMRLLNLNVPPFLIGSTVNAVLAQRLVRKICVNCIESYSPPPALKKQIETEAARKNEKARMPSILYRGKGCSTCGNTGYEGRIGIFELFTIDENVKSIINSQGLNSEMLKKAAKEQNMTSMFEDGINKAEVGVTTIEEVMRVISE
ncbi:MAG: type II/IV secretion system protein [Candidatus Brennerbacteria bacterium]|nr:type II/IV secretion system protein [Candidatus Brennerbacteria bacterium]